MLFDSWGPYILPQPAGHQAQSSVDPVSQPVRVERFAEFIVDGRNDFTEFVFG